MAPAHCPVAHRYASQRGSMRLNANMVVEVLKIKPTTLNLLGLGGARFNSTTVTKQRNTHHVANETRTNEPTVRSHVLLTCSAKQQ